MKKKITILTVFAALLLISMQAKAQWPTAGMRGNGNSAATAWEIRNASDLAALAEYVNNNNGNATSGKHYKLVADIDLQGWTVPAGSTNGWMPIGKGNGKRIFQGVFNGNKHVVKNLTINRTTEDYVGLFGRTEGATIHDLGLEGGSVNGGTYVGALVGSSENGSKIVRCYVACSVGATKQRADVGALVGCNYSSVSGNSEISDSYATGRVVVPASNANVGGLVGNNNTAVLGNSSIINCYSTSVILVNSGSCNIGGLAGHNNGRSTIRNCVAANDSIISKLSANKINRILGDNDGEGCYDNHALTSMVVINNNVVTTRTDNAENGTGKTRTVLQTQGTYTGLGWNFTTVWKMCPENYPVFIGQTCPEVTYQITASASANSSITPNGNVTVKYGDDQAFSFTANTGYLVDSLFIDGINTPDSIAGGSYTFTNVTENHTIRVTSKRIAYTITASSNANGSITPSGTVTVYHGDDQTFTFAPNTGYRILQVLVDGTSNAAAVTAGSYTFTGVTENHTIAVSYERIPYTITASSGTGGSITPSGTVTVLHGDDQTFTFSPNTGYRILQVLVDGTANATAVTDGNYTFAGITENHTIAVSYERIPYTITASSGTGGSISPNGAVTVFHGDDQTFTFTPNTGYRILQVLVDGTANAAAVTAGSYTFTDVTENHTIAVSYERIPYTITASSGTGGSITSNGTVTVFHGDDQAFTFTPNTGYRILQVLVDGTANAAAVTAGSYTFTDVTENHTIAVSYERIPYTITASSGTEGSISPNGTVTVLHGDDQTFTFAPNSGYRILQVLVDGTPNAAAVTDGSYTFTGVTENHTIAVSYESIPSHTITASSGTGGSISPNGTVTVLHGDDQAFTFTPNTGYRILQVLVDGTPNTTAVTDGSYTFYNVTEDHTIAVSYERIPYTITASSGTGGSISPNGTVTVLHGNNQAFTFTPNTGYRVLQVLVDGSNNPAAVAAGSYTFINVTENHTIAVSYERIPYTITASSGTGGSISPNETVTVLHGDDQAFTFTPNTGYRILQVLVDGTPNATAVADGSYTFTGVTENHTIAVSYERIPYTITASSGTGGSISPSGSITVLHGDDQTFTFTTDDHYEIFRVFVDGEYAAGNVPDYTFTDVTANHTIQVDFKPIKHIITASVSEGDGSISPEGNVMVNEGATAIFTITPTANSKIKDVRVDGGSVGAVSTYTFTNVTSGHTIEAFFEQLQYEIAASCGAGGNITPKGNIIVNAGDDQSFAITPNTGYEIKDVVVDGSSVGVAEKYTFTGIQANHSIFAEFEEITYLITASCGENGSISPEGTVEVPHGDSHTCIITPDEGYKILQVLVNGVNEPAAVSSGMHTFSNITDHHTIEASFELITGLEDPGKSALRVYPNPTTGKLNVESGKWNVERIVIFNLTGQKMFETTEKQFSIEQLPAGVYILKTGTQSVRVIKN